MTSAAAGLGLGACAPATSHVEQKGGPPQQAATPPAPSPEEARAFIDRTEADLKKLWSHHERIKFVELTYVNHDTEALVAEAEARTMAFLSEKSKEARRFDGLKLDGELGRKLKLLKLAQSLVAPPAKAEQQELADIATFLESTYAKGKFCKPAQKGEKGEAKCLTLDAISREMATSRDYDRLAELWQGWHQISRPMKQKYARYVELQNHGARELGYPDLGAFWRDNYDMSPDAFAGEVERLWGQVRPLYQQMHCYARKKLNEKYGARVGKTGPIPAHLLGNMWAQEWSNIYPIVAPKGADAKGLDLKVLLEKKKTTPQQMVKYGEGFFTSLGLMPLPETFWQRSMFVRPKDREVMCHASAWDITYGGDVRLKMCIDIDDENFQTVHHELGHDYYYLYYNQLPVLFQQGAHDGFHEAIGDTIALSITPGYLKQIGLLAEVPASKDGDVALLLRRALDAVAFLPFGKLIDQWRWDVFSGKVKPEEYNRAWWALREKYQGLAPPSPRAEEDFDPGAKMHIPGNTPYIRYFLARILQYQFHKALCETAGHKGPLHTCSIYGNKAAGERLKKLLTMGTSRPWPEEMEAITGQKQMDATALLDYYKPLSDWLAVQNKGEQCGW